MPAYASICWHSLSGSPRMNRAWTAHETNARFGVGNPLPAYATIAHANTCQHTVPIANISYHKLGMVAYASIVGICQHTVTYSTTRKQMLAASICYHMLAYPRVCNKGLHILAQAGIMQAYVCICQHSQTYATMVHPSICKYMLPYATI